MLNEALTYIKYMSYADHRSKKCNIYNSIANIYILKSEFKNALKVINKAQVIAEELQDFEELERVYAQLYEIHKEFENHKLAYQSVDKCREAQTKRYQVNLSNKITNLESALNHERKTHIKKEKELLKNNEDIKDKLEHYQSAYKELLEIGEVGVFSDKIRNILDIAHFFHKARNVSVLIEGETGTGKEIIARVVHFGKDGNAKPFISINCSAISPGLFESELFGYADGAFTGARPGGMIGKLELAQHGTLFLDEIGEMPVELQEKLLRVIQQKEFYRVGGNETIKLDIRIICATNKNLKIEMEEKRFRSDLYYRLTTGKIFVPPLRERKEEIVPLAQMFLMQFSKEKKRKFKYIDNDALHFLENYDWPGNVRELQNTIERIVLLNNSNSIMLKHLNFISEDETDLIIEKDMQTLAIHLPEEGINIKEIQRIAMSNILKRFNGNKSKAAEYLKMSRKTFYKYDL